MNTDTFSLSAQEAYELGDTALGLREAARVLVGFRGEEPGIAAQAGIELPALEAAMILNGGVTERIASMREASQLSGNDVRIARQDFEAVARLESTVALASARIDAHLSALDEARRSEGINGLTKVIGLASSAVSVYHMLF